MRKIIPLPAQKRREGLSIIGEIHKTGGAYKRREKNFYEKAEFKPKRKRKPNGQGKMLDKHEAFFYDKSRRNRVGQ